MASSPPLNTLLRCDIRYTYSGYPTELHFRTRGDYPNADMIRRYLSEQRLRHAILRRSFVRNKDYLLNAIPAFHTVAKPELDKMKAEEAAKSPKSARSHSARGPRRPNYQEEEEEQARRMTKSEIRSVILRLNAQSQGAAQAGDLGSPADKNYVINGGRITSAPPLHMRPRPRTAQSPKRKTSPERLTQRPRTSGHVQIEDADGVMIEDCRYFNS